MKYDYWELINYYSNEIEIKQELNNKLSRFKDFQ